MAAKSVRRSSASRKKSRGPHISSSVLAASAELQKPSSNSDLSITVRPLSTQNGSLTVSRPATTSKSIGMYRSGVPPLEMYESGSQMTSASSVSGSRSDSAAMQHSLKNPGPVLGGQTFLVGSKPKQRARTAVPHISTAVPRTSTAVPHTSTAVLHTSTAVLHTSTTVPHTSTAVLHTSTAVPHTSTAVLHTSTAVPYTEHEKRVRSGFKQQGDSLLTHEPANSRKELTDISVGHDGANKLVVVDSDEFQSRIVSAAIKIQRWYRKAKHRQHQAHLLHVLMADKRSKLSQSIGRDSSGLVALSQERKDVEAKRRRHKEEKARDSRQAAIVSLQKMREEKRLLAQMAAEEEYALLEASGKVKPKAVMKRTTHGKNSSIKASPVMAHEDVKMKKEPQTEVPPPPTSDTNTCDKPAATADTVDAIFDANRLYRQPPVSVGTAMSSGPSSTGNSGDQSRLSSTKMSDILEALKILEEEPHPLDPVRPLSSVPQSTGSFTPWEAGVESKQTQQGQPDHSKFSDILAYLDEVEATTSETTSKAVASRTKGLLSPSSNTAVSTSGSGSHGKLDAASAVTMDVTSAIQSLRMEVDDKNRTVEMLQKALSQQRELTIYHAKEQEKEGNRRLDIQKQEYETTIKRHLSFIDQLIDDKKGLSERCEKLLSQMKELERRSTMKIKTMEERHGIELERQRENLVNAEKQRREKWMLDQSKKIKEVTVKGLEPEIQRIIAKHKAELAKVKALHEADLLQADERASRKFVQQTQELREQLQKEKEADCAREREMARNQYEKAASQEEAAYQQQRRRLYAEVEEEKERLALLAQQQRADLDRKMKEMTESHSKSISECKSEYEKSLSEQEHRHASELRNLTERFKIEKEAWEENYMKKQEAILLCKERELKDKLRKDRDKEIELVISRLEEETRTAKEECEMTAEGRIKRIRDKYENELKEVEKSEKTMRDKYTSAKEKVLSLESELVDLKALVRKKGAEIEQISEVSSKLTKERDDITAVVRQEFADKIVSTDEENKSLKIEMSELRARQKVELDQARKKMEKEMEQVHERVKQAILKKEEAMKSLRDQHEAALKRAEHLEMLLERQRQELLKK